MSEGFPIFYGFRSETFSIGECWAHGETGGNRAYRGINLRCARIMGKKRGRPAGHTADRNGAPCLAFGHLGTIIDKDNVGPRHTINNLMARGHNHATDRAQANAMDREFETTLQPICVRENIGVIPNYTLAAGFLTGKYRSEADLSGRARGGTIARYLKPEKLAHLAKLDAVAGSRVVSMAEIAFAWLRDRPAVVAPIASATNLEQLASLMRGAALTLTPQEIAALVDRI